ncbi:hypothetical protein C8F01DRAFT_1108169 [Mycena amicta]|nr:hypothetical protein C8F01DRAFT_1108169 [Mycena amicta]
MAARVHNTSNRAKPTDALEKKDVFKCVLDSPFRVSWPLIPMNVQKMTLDITLELLENVSKYKSGRRRQKRPIPDVNGSNKKRKLSETDSVIVPTSLPDAAMLEEETIDRPPILDHLCIGINQVTKRLDTQIRSMRKVVSVPSEPQQSPPVPLRLILVCRADIDPHILIDHFPHEIAAINSAKPTEPVKMIYLPAGAEIRLAEAVGVRRIAALGLDANTPGLDKLHGVMQEVDVITAPWLSSNLSYPAPVQRQLVPTHVKQTRTTAPKDMKMAKLLRAQGKNAAKKIRKDKKAVKKAKEEAEKKDEIS